MDFDLEKGASEGPSEGGLFPFSGNSRIDADAIDFAPEAEEAVDAVEEIPGDGSGSPGIVGDVASHPHGGGPDVAIGLSVGLGAIFGGENLHEGIECFFVATGFEVGGDFEAGGVTVDVSVGEEAGRSSGQLADVGIVFGEGWPAGDRTDGGIDLGLVLFGDAGVCFGINCSGEHGPTLRVDKVFTLLRFGSTDTRAVVANCVEEVIVVPSVFLDRFGQDGVSLFAGGRDLFFAPGKGDFLNGLEDLGKGKTHPDANAFALVASLVDEIAPVAVVNE